MANIENVRVRWEAGLYGATDGENFTITCTDRDGANVLLKAQIEKEDEGIWTQTEPRTEPELVTTHAKHS